MAATIRSFGDRRAAQIDRCGGRVIALPCARKGAIMRTTWPRAMAAILICGAAALTAGCGIIAPPQRTADTANVDGEITEVRIDSSSGSVIVEGDDDAEGATIERAVTTRANRTVGPTHSVDGSTLVLSGCGRWCSVDYVARIAEGVDVSGNTANGAIELTDVGEVDVRTTNGRISLDGVAGDVTAESSNGRIEGEGLDGSGVDVSTSNGSVDVELGAPQDVRARTSNGPIELRVPDGSYRVTAQTSNGPTDVQIPNSEDGRYLLDLGTSNGPITVRAAD